MDIGGWLRNLGLGQYEASFRDNEIDGEVLPNLTADDLKELGVAIIGHRRKLLTAISELHARDPAPTPVMAAAASPASAQAERRPITVMFCDLVGSTSLAARLDPEDWRNLVGSYLDAASTAVTSLGGHVLKKLGDGLMVLFGYPQAQENDGERAVRASLAIQRALIDLNARNAAIGVPELAARIGLESGGVVVDHTGEVYGEAPNVAARVQSAAAPGEIWITRAVHRQIAGLFVAEDKGEHELKGVPEKTQLFRVVRVSGGGRRGGSRAPTPLVGRGEELDILARRWERARRGDGQLVLITGEPGLGKSRLIEEFRGRLVETPHTWIEWASSQLLQNTPLHPAAEWGRARFGGAEVAGERRYAELEAALGSVGLDAAEYAPLLAPVIDAPTPPGRAPKLSPEELRSRQLAALAAWVLAGARTQPLVLAFEDLHWADPTSLDVLQALAERGAQAPLLILATTRPEFRPPWKLRSHHGVISLAPLDAGEIAKMIGEIATRHALSKDVIAGVSERTGGVPLFVEEVTRLLLERGEAGGAQAIPPTLQQSLAARLDRLGSAREIAQIGAVLGRGFSYALLQAVAGLDEPALRAALDRLADAELLFVEGVAPHANYRFKHALIQDAAYDSLLKSRRQTLHRRAAEVLLASPAPEAEALAHHFTLGGETELAIEWWGKAGDQALRRSAFAEAISHLGKAIELSDKAGGAAKPREAAAAPSAIQKLKLQSSYGQAVMWSKGFAAEETKAVFARVGELTTQIGNADAPLDAYYARWGRSFFLGELGLARETAENFLREAERARRPTEAGVAHRLLGMTFLFQGDFAQARAHCEQAQRIYALDRDRDAKFRFGQDSAVGAVGYLALSAWCVGDVARATELMNEALARAVESAHVPTLANTYLYQAWLESFRSDAEAARRAAEAAIALSREHGLALHLSLGTLPSAWAHAKLGDREAGAAELRQALAEYASGGNKVCLPTFQGLLAEIDAERGDPETALAEIDGALALAGETGEHWFDAGLHRIRGEILIKQNPADPAPAEDAFLAAIAVAQQQKARSFELRAALSLAKLYQSTGRPIDAHDVLAPALAGFSSTPEFPAIAEAKALQADLMDTEAVKAATEKRQARVKLHTDYAQAFMLSKGYAATETSSALAKAGAAIATARVAGNDLGMWVGLWANQLFRGEIAAARAVVEDWLQEARSKNLRDLERAALSTFGATRFFLGEIAESHTVLIKALADASLAPEYARSLVGVDTIGQLSAHASLSAWALGNPDEAQTLVERSIERAKLVDAPATLVLALVTNLSLAVLTDRPETALGRAEEMRAAAAEKGVAAYGPQREGFRIWACGRLEDPLTAAAALKVHIETCITSESGLLLPFFHGLLADLTDLAGRGHEVKPLFDAAFAISAKTGEHWFDAGLHRIRGQILLKQNPAPAEAAFLAAIAIAQQQKARSFELRAALSLAKLYQSTGRPIDAHDVLGPALAGFSPTPEFPQIAEAKALFEALAGTETVKAEAARRAQRLKLQTNYGQAVMWSKGFAAEETKAAFARVGELATEMGNAEALLEAYYAQWTRSFFRGELRSARESAESFLREAERGARPTEAAVAHRILGCTLLFRGDFAQAKAHCEQTLRIYDPERDREAKFRFGLDSAAQASGFLALMDWCCGNVARARELMDEAVARAIESTHAPTLATTYYCWACLELLRDDAEAARHAAEALVALSREHGLAIYFAGGALLVAWARAKLGDREAGSAELRQVLAGYASQGNKTYLPIYRGLLAELEAEGGNGGAALAGIDEALMLAGETGEHWFDAGLHRIRGEILVKRNPADPAPAEAAFLAAIAVAQQQKARSFELRAALSLAKLYQSTGRPVEAHVLGPALVGFSPTPEFPAIAEAQALFEALAADETVKADAARRAQRLKLQTDYGQALMWSKGFVAEETKAALARVGELATDMGAAGAPLDAYLALWGHNLWRGELPAARETAERFLREAERKARPTEAATAHRCIGTTLLLQGDFAEARAHFEQTLRIYDPERDREAKFGLGVDSRVAATSLLAYAAWCCGDVGRARELMVEAGASAVESAHAPTFAIAYNVQAMIEMLRGDAEATRRAAEAIVALSREHGLAAWLALGALQLAWARAKLGDRDARSAELRQALADYANQGNRVLLPFYQGLFAEIEAEGGGAEGALAGIDGALALAAQTGEHRFDAGLHRIRGEILIKQNPADPAAAEAAFLAAIAVAQQQKARSFELRAALSLAKLYQSAGRPVDARDVLGPALAGFSPTPEFPQVAEAHTLLAALAADETVAAHLRQRETRAKLHSGFALATMMTKGFGADETKAALARAEGAYGVAKTPDYWTVRYGRLAGDLMAAKFDALREGAIAFIAEAEAAGQPGHASVARRVLGFAKIIIGDFAGAATDLRRAVADYDDARDAELNAQYGHDLLANALATLAQATWYLGDVDESDRLVEAAIARAEASGRVVSQIQAIACRNFFALQADRPEILLENARKILRLAERHELAVWKMWASETIISARACLGEPCADAYREEFERLPDFGGRLMSGLRYGFLARVERAVGRAPEALAAIERALALGAENGEGEFTTLRLRLRGDIRAERDPAAAEADFHAALDLARAQGSPTLALLAALDLAKFLRARRREPEAHDALAPSLAGIAPTPNLPAIAEAQALLAELAGNDAVAAHLRQRETRAKLHSGYALASMMTKGFGSEETKEALARAETAAGTARTPQYWAVWYGRINADQSRGDFRSARAGAEAFLAEAAANGLEGHAAAARLRLGFCKFIGGELAAARGDHERALADLREGDDASLRATISIDLRSSALMELGSVAFHLGEFEEAERRIGEAITRAKISGPPISYVYTLFARILIGGLGGRNAAILSDIAELKALAEEHGLKFYAAMAASLEHWTRARLGEPAADAFRAGLGAYAGLGARLIEVLLQSLLADVELAAGRPDEALAAVERGLELGAEIGDELSRPWFMRRRGDALADSDPAGAASAYREAIKIAGAQGARPAALLAALALAKVLPSIGETIEAHSTLSEALAGFSPTPLFPAIAEAQARLGELSADETVAAELRKREVRSKLHSGFALATMMTKGFGADETKAALARAAGAS